MHWNLWEAANRVILNIQMKNTLYKNIIKKEDVKAMLSEKELNVCPLHIIHVNKNLIHHDFTQNP